MLGYIIADLFLTPLINKISDNKTTIVSLVLLIIGILNLPMINDYTLLKINVIVMASAYYTYITTTIIKIVELTNNYKYFALKLSFLGYGVYYRFTSRISRISYKWVIIMYINL